MRIIGLTGGIACGKSTVSAELRKCGAAIIDADALAHELSQPHQPLFHAYVQRFGREIVTADGTLDRAAIARCVFADPAVRAEVDAIAHPIIRMAAEERLRVAAQAQKRAAAHPAQRRVRSGTPPASAAPQPLESMDARARQSPHAHLDL